MFSAQFYYSALLVRCMLTEIIGQDCAIANRQYPASNTGQGMENHVKQSPACAPGTPSLLRQPSPLKELWVRSQITALGQQSPATSTIPYPSPLQMHLFGIICSLPNIPPALSILHLLNLASTKKTALLVDFQTVLGSQLPQSRLPMPKSWLSSTATPLCVFTHS